MLLFADDPTPVDRPTDVCPDPDTHARRMSEREQSWREKDNTVAGFCGWCGKKLDAGAAHALAAFTSYVEGQ